MTKWLNIRSIAGVALLFLFVKLIRPVLSFDIPGMESFGQALLAMAVLVLAAITFSGHLSEWASRPLVKMIDSIYFGSDDPDARPPVTLKLVRVYRAERRYGDAVAECERQLEFHPRSPELWIEMIRSAKESGEAKLAQRYLRRARRRLRPDDRPRLMREFSGLEG